MRKFAALSLCLALAAAIASAQPQQPSALFSANLQAALATMVRGNCEVWRDAAAIMEDREFGGVGDYTRMEFLRALFLCADESNEPGVGFAAAERAAAIRPDTVWAQFGLLVLGTRLQAPQAALDAHHRLAQIAPAAIASREYRYVGVLVSEARRIDPSGALLLRYYEDLLAVNYNSGEPGYTDEWLRVDLARLLIESGRTDEARQRIGSIRSVNSIIRIRSLRVFDPLRTDAAFAAQLDAPAASERELAELAALVRDNPRSAQVVVRYAEALITANRLQDCISLIEETIHRMDQEPASFNDADAWRNWLLNFQGEALYGLGRYDEGRAVYQRAARQPETGRANVSQAINFAHTLIGEQRPREALQALASLTGVSPYGAMEALAVRVCAEAMENRRSHAFRLLARMRQNEEQNPLGLVRAMLCVQRDDQAAAVLIRGLEAPYVRESMLRRLQVFTAPSQDPPFARVLDERMRALAQRPDVLAAVNTVGRIETYPFNR